MDPIFAISAVRAIIRIGDVSKDAFSQYAQEKPILLPSGESIPHDPIIAIRDICEQYPAFTAMLENDEELKKRWADNRETEVPGALETVYLAAVQFEADQKAESRVEGVDPSNDFVEDADKSKLAAGAMVSQWAVGQGPVSPVARVFVSLADVALEFVSADPSILGVGGKGEKLIGAISLAVSEAIPDIDTRASLGPKDRFAERLSGLALRACLQAVTSNPDLVVEEKSVQQLLKNSLPPIIAAMPSGDGSIAEQIKWHQVTDAFFGPALSAALDTISNDPSAFLGGSFDREKAAGVMVTGLLKAAAKQDLETRFSKSGVIELARAAAGIAAENPALILGELLGNDDLTDPQKQEISETISVHLFAEISATLAHKKAPFSEGLGVAIAASMLEGLKKAGPQIFKSDRPWDVVASKGLNLILDGFSDALLKPDGSFVSTVFNKDQLIELARVVVAQVATTPHMLGTDNKDIQRVVSGVAKAMAADKKLLLTREDWVQIIAVAAEEAALNPGRLFGINDKNPEGLLATELITQLLDVAAEDLQKQTGKVGPVLIGTTLRDAITTTLRSVGGNIHAAVTHKTKMKELAQSLTQVAAARQFEIGGKEWKRLYMHLLPGVLRDGVIPTLSAEKIEDILSAG
ncbi:hypothetical protein [Sneathiella sp.]|jgi:hypothetical protein|uniref:hypothetical protein n=1 Tax=Sneathiella sp. TaxID=1964365 RepID=UPI0039E62ECE